MNLKEVNEATKELLNSPLTLSNARNLSALITIQSYMKNAIQSKPDGLEQELNDILPQYKEYCNIKRGYQLGKLSDTDLIVAMRHVCKEIKDFLLLLYENTEIAQERTQLKAMLKEIQDAL